MATDWYMEGPWIKNCNCDPGCPCDFNANPTAGFCEGLVAMKIENDIPTKTIDAIQPIPEGYMGLDISPKTVKLYAEQIADAGTIIWNGPMGVFEEPPFDQGTIGIASAVAEAADRGAIVVVGGGDSVAAVTKAGVADRITHISTGGGATLEFLAGEELPGVAALNDR